MTKDETMSWVEEISVAGQPAFCLRNAVGDQVVVFRSSISGGRISPCRAMALPASCPGTVSSRP